MKKAEAKIIARLGLSEVDVIEAKEDITISVSIADGVAAKGKAPNACALARAALRRKEVLQAWFWPSVAYVHYRTGKYAGKLVRYTTSNLAREAINNFDISGKIPEGEYALLAPTGTNTLDAARKRGKKRPGRHEPTDKSGITRKHRFSSRANWSKADE